MEIILKIVISRSSMWDFMEKPWTSLGAQMFAVASLSVLFISTITFIVSTVEEITEVEEDKPTPAQNCLTSATLWTSSHSPSSHWSISAGSFVHPTNGGSSNKR